jgi:hypothetical protein
MTDIVAMDMEMAVTAFGVCLVFVILYFLIGK